MSLVEELQSAWVSRKLRAHLAGGPRCIAGGRVERSLKNAGEFGLQIGCSIDLLIDLLIYGLCTFSDSFCCHLYLGLAFGASGGAKPLRIVAI